MENKSYVKLSELVDKDFTVLSVKGFTFKRWNNEERKMEVSDEWKEGFSKKYLVETDKGMLDMGTGQLASLLEAVFYNGVADINGQRFKVKSNGKSGMDIRYFFNRITEKNIPMTQADVFDNINDKPVDISQIPFN